MTDFYIGKIFTIDKYDFACDWIEEQNNPHYTIIEIEPINEVQQFKLIDKTPTEEEQKQKEAERIAKLTMKPLDFINFLVDSGLTLEQINAYLEANLSVKMQLTYCSDVFCEVACSLMPITIDDITITEDMVITAFRIKHGEVIEE